VVGSAERLSIKLLINYLLTFAVDRHSLIMEIYCAC